MCRFGTARALLDQPDWTRPYQQYADTPGGTYWCTAVADAGDHEPFAVAIGTPYEHVKWFRGQGTANGSTSKMPRPALLHPASVAGGQPLVESTPHYSPPVGSLESTNQRCSIV